MADLPPAWKSFLNRAEDYRAEGDLEEAKWSAERSLHYLESAARPNCAATAAVLLVLSEIATQQGEHELAGVLAERSTILYAKFNARKSLWQHLRED
jgi:hypothetical protein